MIGDSEALDKLRSHIERVSAADQSLLLQGESGTGKELVARAIHEAGPRSRAPFVIVDCGALAPGLVASELFGHERGAFTGADTRHVGAFERADGGTLLLDEVGELSLGLQASLLGALERQRFRRVGGSEEIAVDVRVLAATHRTLKEQVHAGLFRLDLYYRLAVVTLSVPSLRERPDDLVPLMRHFLSKFERGDGAELFCDELLARLRAHPWPGNVRELKNFVEATVVMGEPPPLELCPPAEGVVALPGPELPWAEARASLLAKFERSYLERLLGGAGGNVSAAARLAEMDRTYLIELLQRHDLKRRG